MNSLSKAEQLKNELDNLRPLDAEAEARIMQKFRLDWNYHSNNLEGNSLTYGETKALILFGITAQGKPLKDHFEITGHNEAINWILEIVKDKTVLTEAFIRQLHTLLLKESSYKEAETPNGKPTRRKIEVGKYKTQPNHVLTATGETFYFATPEETPAKMQELVEWFRSEKEKPDVNPIILAALFHYRFIRIHPFDDGNGRIARILMNFILMKFGYPPAIIKTEDKENYYAVLRLADAGELEPFIEYITENLIRSLEIMIHGAKGESVEEPDDLDKELALIEKRLAYGKVREKTHKNKQSMRFIFTNSIFPFSVEFVNTCRKFDKLYSESNFVAYVTQLKGTSPYILSGQRLFEDFESYFMPHITQITLNYQHQGLNKNDIFDYTSFVKIKFGKESYTFSLDTESTVFEKSYSEILTQQEIKDLIKAVVNEHKYFIEQKINESKPSSL